MMMPWGRHYAYPHDMEDPSCAMCGQPANRPIPPGQSVREQALGLARQVRHYEQVPETVRETISPNVRSGV